ncbi:hypothetical protein [Hwanghaeella sp. LZ110]|uniref:hypothetical protein n=1 Tax=Hwanghaeella sp. LZ110 TaxID=3402810 RepID=UPI003B674F5A
MPDLIRHPEPPAPLYTCRPWTPDQVRGDGPEPASRANRATFYFCGLTINLRGPL